MAQRPSGFAESLAVFPPDKVRPQLRFAQMAGGFRERRSRL